MASGNTLNIFRPMGHIPDSSAYPSLNLRNQHPILEFTQSGNQIAYWQDVMPRIYSSGGLTVTIIWTTATVSGGGTTASLEITLERLDAATGIGTDSFGSAKTVSITPPTTNGLPVYSTTVHANGAETDSISPGDLFRLKLRRSNTSDNIVDTIQVLAVEVKET